jgi:DNA-binding NarL/FixJ family response regulator
MSVPGGRRGGAAPIRLIVADDHPLWRDTLKDLLEHGSVAKVVAEAATGDEAVTVAATVDADVILLDINMPRMNGIDAARAISDADSSTKILMLSSLTERAEVLASVRAGASGYLLKTAGREEVADAVRRIHGGELVFPPELTNVVLAELRNPSAGAGDDAPPTLASLTARENDVLRLIAEGASNQGIAKQLHLAAKTVEAHIAAIFTKLGLEPSADEHRRVQAAITFLRESGDSEA